MSMHGHVVMSLVPGQKHSEYKVLKQWPVAWQKIMDEIRQLSNVTAAQIARASLFLLEMVQAVCEGRLDGV